jgi:hypothetical protein
MSLFSYRNAAADLWLLIVATIRKRIILDNATTTSYVLRPTCSYCFWQKFKKCGNELSFGKIFTPKFLKIGHTGHYKCTLAIRTSLCLADTNEYKIHFLQYFLIGQYPGIFIILCELLLHVSGKISNFEVNLKVWDVLRDRRALVTCKFTRRPSSSYILRTSYTWKFFFTIVQQPPVGQDLLIHEVSRSHVTTHHSR